ncbi:MAG: hypothetical protein K0U54_09455 [Bacteroidetes bacterium]|nr:hypothetical protein [Bacteroidota bacterium]
MSSSFSQTVKISKRYIFFIQISLILVWGILFSVDYFNEGLKVGAFFHALILGALGASISLMRRVGNMEEKVIAQLNEDKIYSILVSILYGVLMTGVGYLLFMSEILSGDNGGGLFTTNLFPNFTIPSSNSSLLRQFIEMEPEGMKNTGKLLVWSFIAGYSERFVTGILSQLEKQGNRTS